MQGRAPSPRDAGPEEGSAASPKDGGFTWHLAQGDQEAGAAVSSSLDGGPAGLLCPDTETFRRFAREAGVRTVLPGGGDRVVVGQMRKSDRVVEIGSSWGKCTQIIARSLGSPSHVVGLEISKEALKESRTLCPDINFVQADCLLEPYCITKIATALLAMHSAPPTPDLSPGLVFFVDIGGNRELEALVALLPWLMALGPPLLPTAPRLIVVKSQTLFKAATDAGGLGAATWQDLTRTAEAAVGARRNGGQAVARMHPLKYSMSNVPETGVAICRYHNYDRVGGGGCKKGVECPFDHLHCHACLAPGHRAVECEHSQPLLR